MNKIKEAFSTIKLDEDLKNKTYLLIKNKQLKKAHLFKPILILDTALVLTLVLVLNYSEPKNNNFDNNMEMNTNVLSATALGFNSFTYKENNYFLSDIIIKPSDLNTKLGSFDDLVVMDSRIESKTNYQLYTIKNNDKILVVKFGDDLYPFKKK